MKIQEKESWETIRDYVDLMGIKQTKLAQELGISDTTIGLFLKGERKLSQDNIDKLLAFLKI